MEIGAVGQIGKAVISRHVADTGLGLDALGDLLERDNAEFLPPLAGGKLEVASIRKPQEHLAATPLLQCFCKLSFGMDVILPAQELAGNAAQKQCFQSTAEKLVRRVETQEFRRLRVGDDRSSFWTEHDQPV